MPELAGYSDYVVYVDESGDHSLISIDRAFPVFVLVFCIFKKSLYPAVSSRLKEFKFKYFGHDIVVLHEREVRKQIGPFSFLTDRHVRERFMAELTQVICDGDFTLITAVIDKERLVARYRTPDNPYALSMVFCLERLYSFLKTHGQHDKLTHVIVERRGAKEDKELELEFQRVCNRGNRHQASLPFEIVFASKQVNSCGLQLADLIARPIGRKVINPTESNRAYDILDAKFDRSPSGLVRGWGLKVFP
jgi:hypothetical protein